MAGRVIRWVVVALMLAALALTVSSPAMAEVEPLPLDFKVPGRPPKPEGYLSENEYLDSSIHAVVTEFQWHEVTCCAIDVTVADPSQLRTAVSNDNFRDFTYVKGEAMAKHVNAIAAVNGDFFKYHYKDSYVWRQGEFYYDIKNDPGNGYSKSESFLRDVLFIDDRGDFWAVKQATNAKLQDFLAREFPADRRVINTFTFGPVLVEGGEAQPYTTEEFEHDMKMQRVAIVQVEGLNYAIVEFNCMTDGSYGLTMAEFAQMIAEKYPTCRMAFNLDGGGSTHVIFNNERIVYTSGIRNISDILYFASAETEE